MSEIRLFLSYHQKEIRIFLIIVGCLALFFWVKSEANRWQRSKLEKLPIVPALIIESNIAERARSTEKSFDSWIEAKLQVAYSWQGKPRQGGVVIQKVVPAKVPELAKGKTIYIRASPDEDAIPLFHSYDEPESRPNIQQNHPADRDNSSGDREP